MNVRQRFAPPRAMLAGQPQWAYLGGFAIGLAMAAYLFPASFVAGDALIYQQGDFAQHVSGWFFYRTEDWHFPLLRIERLNAPEGTTVAFTDSIPLLALPAKLLASVLPADWHYFGVWHVLVVVLQALGGVFLVRSLGARAVLVSLAGAALAVLAPILVQRVNHSSLLAHFLLLFSLGAYFRGLAPEGTPQAWSQERAVLVLGVLPLVGLLIHPYWLALCSGVFFAYLVDTLIAGTPWWRQLLRLMLFFVVLAAMFLVFGYGGGNMGEAGFGQYSMNLLAPFCNISSPCWVNPTGGQYEGYNYLGAGVLLLLLLSLPGLRGRFRAFMSRYLALVLVLMAYTLYALSNRVFLGNWLVVEVPLPSATESLTSIFRASGRFFWPVGYLLAFVSLAYCWRQYRRPVFAVVLIGLLAFQFWDTQPQHFALRERLAKPAQNDLVPWAPLLAGVERLYLHPAFLCGPGDVEQYWFFQRLAGHYGLSIDTGYISRSNTDCAAKAARFNSPLDEQGLYVWVAPNLDHVPYRLAPVSFRRAVGEGSCGRWRSALLCRPGQPFEDWSDAIPELRPIERLEPHGSAPSPLFLKSR